MEIIWFKDEGQDILCWGIDDTGLVTACNTQQFVWVGNLVTGTDRADNPDDIQPGDYLTILTKKEETVRFIHPVEKCYIWIPVCRDCRYLSNEKVLKEGEYPSVRCTLGCWQKAPRPNQRVVQERWLKYGPVILNRDPAKRFGETCKVGLPKMKN